jgi:hypothetical protein
MDKNNTDLEVYLMNDQPTTCPQCGARTSFDEIDNATQNHHCLNTKCNYEFVTEAED